MLQRLPKNSVNFLCVARLKGDKGLRDYAAAAKIVKKKFPSLLYLI